VSDFDRVFLRKPALVTSREEDLDDSDIEQPPDDEPADGEPSAAGPPAAGREGLPATFRMRADSHYVDLITSRAAAPPVHLIAVEHIDGARPFGERELRPLVESVAAHGIVQPLLVRRRGGRYELISGAKRLAAAAAAGLTQVPCLLRDADDERARALAEAENLRFEPADASDGGTSDLASLSDRAARDIVDSLATIESCLNLILDGERPLRERVALSLVRAEAHRARWLAEAYGLLGRRPAVLRRPTDGSNLIRRALQGLEAESRLVNVKLVLSIDEPSRMLFADERLLSIAVTGAAVAMLGLLQGRGAGAVKVRVAIHRAKRQLAIQFSQKQVAPPDRRMPAPDSPTLPDWPGGHGAALGLAVARHVMDLHGGRVEINTGPKGGCTLALVLPTRD
jgi:ParB-like chromosome segregation protein Spo0J